MSGVSKVWVGLNGDGVGEVSLSTHTHTQYATTNHTHDASDITSGILSVTRGGTGVSSLDSLIANIPVATTTSNGLMSAADKAKMNFISYNWTDAGSGNVPLQSKIVNDAAFPAGGIKTATASYNISSIYSMGITSAAFVRLDFNCSWHAYMNVYTDGPTTGSITLSACGVVIYTDEKTVDGSSIYFSKNYNTAFSLYLLPSGSSFVVYDDLSLSNPLTTVGKSSLTVSTRCYIYGKPVAYNYYMRSEVGSNSSTIHAYLIA